MCWGTQTQFDFSFFSDRRTASRRGSLPMRDSDRKLATILFFPAAAPRPGRSRARAWVEPRLLMQGAQRAQRENKSGFRETGGNSHAQSPACWSAGELLIQAAFEFDVRVRVYSIRGPATWSFSPRPCTQGRGVGGEGFFCRREPGPLTPDPSPPSTGGEGGKNAALLEQTLSFLGATHEVLRERSGGGLVLLPAFRPNATGRRNE